LARISSQAKVDLPNLRSPVIVRRLSAVAWPEFQAKRRWTSPSLLRASAGKPFNVKREERVGRMKEGIELLRAIWSDEEVHHRGKYYTLEDYNIVPKPVQKPPPIWIAVSPEREQVGDKVVDQAMRRVGMLADGYITMGVTAEEFAKRWRVIEGAAGAIWRVKARRGGSMARKEQTPRSSAIKLSAVERIVLGHR